jgi:dTDP-4-amino-4,6-dideoxygalactose transaminase
MTAVVAPQVSRIRLVDLGAQHKILKPQLDAAVRAVIDSNCFIEGEAMEEFEREFAAYCGTSYSVAVDSGTAALQLLLRALGIGPGNEVIVPSNTFIATAAAVTLVGATPVFIDSDPHTWLIDASQAKAAATKRTRAIVGVHLYGNLLPIQELIDIAGPDIFIIEDAAQAHGATLDGKRAGSFGIAGCFSFYPAKNLGAFGDGGAITVNNPELKARLERLRNHGRTTKYEHAEVGFNYRMDAIQAAVLRIKLKYLDEWNQNRRQLAAAYRRNLERLPLRMPKYISGSLPVHHLFPICCPERDRLSAFLAERGVETGVHYPVPLHLQPAFTHLGYKRGQLPVAERIASTILSLPLYPEMSNEQLEYICSALHEFFHRRQ